MQFQATVTTATEMAALCSAAVPSQLGLALPATPGVDMRTALVDFVPPRCGVSPPKMNLKDGFPKKWQETWYG
jgi:hypothetical protein